MNRITELMKKGYFVQDIKILSELSNEEFDYLINKLPKSNIPKVLTSEEIRKIVGERKEVKRKSVDIRVEKFEIKKDEIRIIDVIEIYKKRYEKLSSLLKNELRFFNLISINKISKKHQFFSIVGMVYDIQQNKLVVEDLTSRVEIYLSEKVKEKANFLEKDIVVGVKCKWDSEKIVAEDILFPEFKDKDFEIYKNLNLDAKIGILSSLENPIENIDVPIFLGGIQEDYMVDSQKIFLNTKFLIFRFWLNEFLFVIINGDILSEFNKDTFLRTRLLFSDVSKLLKNGYRDDAFLVENLPFSIIVLNSKKENFDFSQNPYVLHLLKSKNYILDFSNKSISTL